jgi:hypothetical protein
MKFITKLKEETALISQFTYNQLNSVLYVVVMQKQHISEFTTVESNCHLVNSGILTPEFHATVSASFPYLSPLVDSVSTACSGAHPKYWVGAYIRAGF